MTLLEQTLAFMKPENWTQFHHARGIDNYPCDPTDPQAVRFCLDGALHKLCGKSKYSQGDSAYIYARDKLREISSILYPEVWSYSHANDLYGFDAVVKLLKEAIKNENSRHNLCSGLDSVHSKDNRFPR